MVIMHNGVNPDGTAQNVQSKLRNCGFSVHVVSGVIINRRQFGECSVILSVKSFGGIRAYDDTQSDPQFLDTIPSLSDLYIIDRTQNRIINCLWFC